MALIWPGSAIREQECSAEWDIVLPAMSDLDTCINAHHNTREQRMRHTTKRRTSTMATHVERDKRAEPVGAPDVGLRGRVHLH